MCRVGLTPCVMLLYEKMCLLTTLPITGLSAKYANFAFNVIGGQMLLLMIIVFFNVSIPASLCLFSSFPHDTIQILIDKSELVCLGLEPRVVGWMSQTNPLSFGGTPLMNILFIRLLTQEMPQ